MASEGIENATEHAAPVVSEPQLVRHTHEGVDYLALLSAMHRALNPQSYLEIGSDTGNSLRLARCATIAIDPKFKIGSDVIGEKPMLAAFQVGSDEFFRSGHLATLLPKGVDFAFLDGMHLFEYLLRDFMNVEKASHWRTVIAVHDCLPPNIEIAERDYRPHLRTDDMWRIYWTGDVWKLVPILRCYRPDLTLTFFDCPPSGLLMIKGLDASSTVLQDNYEAILQQYRALDFDKASYEAFYAGITITPSSDLLHGMSLSAFL